MERIRLATVKTGIKVVRLLPLDLPPEVTTVLDNMIRLNVDDVVAVRYLEQEAGGIPLDSGQFVYNVYRARYEYRERQVELPKRMPKIGCRVRFTHTIRDIPNSLIVRTTHPIMYKWWGGSYADRRKAQTGVLIGYRTLWSRFVDMHTQAFKNDLPLKIGLVVRDARSNPIRIALQGMEVLD